MGRGLTIAAMIAALALAACGDDDEQPEPPDPAELAAFLPEASFDLRYVDLDGARAQLGVAEDADPAELPDRGDEAEAAFLGAASGSLPHISYAYTEYFDPGKDPLVRSIDHTQVSAAAAAATTDGAEMVVLVSSEPFGEIASALAKEGWSREGDVVEGRGDKGVFGAVADGGDGRILIATGRESIEGALAGRNSGPPLAAVLADVDGTVRFATEFEEGFACVTLVAGGEDLASGSGTVLFEPVGDPAPILDRLARFDAAQLEEPRERGDQWRVAFSGDDLEGSTPVAQSIAAGIVTGGGSLEKVGPGFGATAIGRPDCGGPEA